MSTNTLTKQFQYEIQSYQEDCVNNIISIFERLRRNENFNTVLTEHHQKHKYNFPVTENKNIDIMMETGTGKTFAFIKTIFELNKNFGYKKFIILIPTVPIREGTKTNLEDTKEYFKTYYANEADKEIETYVYEGGNISSVKQFIGTSQLSVLIMTNSSFSSKDNILNRPLDYEVHNPELFVKNQSPLESYLDCLKRLEPIVIMDEPHRFEGDAFKKYFEGFDNYYLRFGATFPKKKDSIVLSNVAYVLDSISSFRQNLVKKIVVYTQDVVDNADTLINIENNKAIVNTINNGVVVRRELGKGGVFNQKSIKKINKTSIVLSDDTIVKIDYSLEDESLRAMISDTIKIHLEKERELFYKGIKALTLFFIQSDIELYRGSDPKIKNVFEKEYIEIRKNIYGSLKHDDPFKKYLDNDFDNNGNLQVHKGYFSGDKGNTDEKVKAGVNEILKDKKKLLSFESPTRFIFSIWALQEGWDNPNVFTICKLSNQGSEISKLQQIGRGLRICVNQNLQRLTLKALDNNQEEFWKINNLDVVVSNKEQGFVEAIQNEILNNSFLVANTFTEADLTIKLQQRNIFSNSEIIDLIDNVLKFNKLIIGTGGIINGNRIYEKSPDFIKILKEVDIPLEQKIVLENLFASDANTYIQKSGVKPKKKIIIKDNHLKEFQELWNAINKNAFYLLDKLSIEQENVLINNIKIDIEKLNIHSLLIQTTKAILNIDKIENDGAISEEVIKTIPLKSKVNYLEFVSTISNNTKTPLQFVIKIFNSLKSEFKFTMLTNNPAQAQKEISEIINQNLINTIKANVKYDGISGRVLPNVFKTENGKSYLEPGTVGKFQKDIVNEFSLKEKWVFEDVIEYDSEFELLIVEKDPNIDEIEIFGKLPKLHIKTPLGEYNPDFCYAVKTNEGNKIFLVVESKGYNSSSEIPTNEKAKIDFAKKYFEALNNHYVNNNNKIKISYKERINRTQLASLINNN